MSAMIFDLNQLYRQTFGGNPHVPKVVPTTNQDEPFQISEGRSNVSQISGSAFTAQYLDKEIWLPVKFYDLNVKVFGTDKILLPYAVVKLSAKKNIIKTAISERKGTVKELYSIDDYQINLKGFVIDEKKRSFPEEEIIVIKNLFEQNESFAFDNAITNVFMREQRVVIQSLDLLEVEGSKHIRPFNMTLESDSIFMLEA